MLDGMAEGRSARAGAATRDGANGADAGDESARHRVRLPNFIVQEPMGAGPAGEARY
jgi:hypothetical protein